MPRAAPPPTPPRGLQVRRVRHSLGAQILQWRNKVAASSGDVFADCKRELGSSWDVIFLFDFVLCGRWIVSGSSSFRMLPHRGSTACLTFDLSGPPSSDSVRRLQDRYQMGVGGLN